MELMNKLGEKAPQEGEQDRALLQEALQAVVRMLKLVHPARLLYLVAGELGGEGAYRQRAVSRLPTSRYGGKYHAGCRAG